MVEKVYSPEPGKENKTIKKEEECKGNSLELFFQWDPIFRFILKLMKNSFMIHEVSTVMLFCICILKVLIRTL